MSNCFESNSQQNTGEEWSDALQPNSSQEALAPSLQPAADILNDAACVQVPEPEGLEPGTIIPGFTLEESVALRGVRVRASLVGPYDIDIRYLRYARQLVKKGIIRESL